MLPAFLSTFDFVSEPNFDVVAFVTSLFGSVTDIPKTGVISYLQ